VKRWWEGISRCGTATGLLEAEKKYRRIGLSRTPVAKGTPESIAHSAEGGQNSEVARTSIAGRLTVPNVESRCNQLKLGHPR